MAGVPTPERQLLPDSGAARALRSQSNRAVATPATSTSLSITSKGSARTVVFDHRQSLVSALALGLVFVCHSHCSAGLGCRLLLLPRSR